MQSINSNIFTTISNITFKQSQDVDNVISSLRSAILPNREVANIYRAQLDSLPHDLSRCRVKCAIRDKISELQKAFLSDYIDSLSQEKSIFFCTFQEQLEVFLENGLQTKDLHAIGNNMEMLEILCKNHKKVIAILKYAKISFPEFIKSFEIYQEFLQIPYALFHHLEKIKNFDHDFRLLVIKNTEAILALMKTGVSFDEIIGEEDAQRRKDLIQYGFFIAEFLKTRKILFSEFSTMDDQLLKDINVSERNSMFKILKLIDFKTYSNFPPIIQAAIFHNVDLLLKIQEAGLLLIDIIELTKNYKAILYFIIKNAEKVYPLIDWFHEGFILGMLNKKTDKSYKLIYLVIKESKKFIELMHYYSFEDFSSLDDGSKIKFLERVLPLVGHEDPLLDHVNPKMEDILSYEPHIVTWIHKNTRMLVDLAEFGDSRPIFTPPLSDFLLGHTERIEFISKAVVSEGFDLKHILDGLKDGSFQII